MTENVQCTINFNHKLCNTGIRKVYLMCKYTN